MKRTFFMAIAALVTAACASQTNQPKSPDVTTTTGAPVKPNNDGSTPTQHLDVVPPEHQPDSQPASPGSAPISMQGSDSLAGSPNGATALSDTTTGPAPHNSSDVSGGTPQTMQAGTTAATIQPTPSEDDKKTTARIKKALESSSSLSFGAKYITVETLSGHVTLRGSVKSDRERQIVETEATKIAGPSRVDDQLTVTK